MKNYLANIAASVARKFGAAGGGYDATLPKGKRKTPLARSRSEDAELNNAERIILGGSTRDLRRNFAVAAWAIRKHLDYVSSFTFECGCQHSRALRARFNLEDLQAVDEQVAAIVQNLSRAKNFDAGGRHSLKRMTRIAEALRTVDGDCLPIKRSDGKIQLVESDRIKNPVGGPANGTGLSPADMLNVINGVLIDPNTGAALGYCVHKRDRSGMSMKFDRLVPGAFATLHGYFDRYDQVRGISPLAAAVNPLRDLYESFDYALAKEKVSQLFALSIFRENAEKLGVLDQEEQTDSEGDEQEGYSVDFGKGPMLLDLEPGDKAEVIESANPSTESQSFWNMILMVALKALDIPMCFFDEDHGQYPGLRVAWLQYDQSATTKCDDNRDMLNDWTIWRLSRAILDDELVLPPGMRLTDLALHWVAKGVPWVDQLKEVTANIAAIAAGIGDPQEILRSQGKDPFKVIDSRAQFEAYAKEQGVTLSFNLPNLAPASVEEEAGATDPTAQKTKPKKSNDEAK